jgi:hypothetical protein
MKVIIDARLFAGPRSYSLELLAIIGLCFEGRHALLVEPPYDPDQEHPEVTPWLRTLPEQLRQEVQYALEAGPVAASQYTSSRPCIRVEEVAHCLWETEEPVLTPDIALRLLRRPLKLLVENRRSDGAFLRKMMSPKYRKSFEESLEKGWLEIENGGGLGELKKRVEVAVSQKDMLECGRMWVMFDSDAREPGKASKEAGGFLMYCRECHQEFSLPWPVGAHMLERRSIESYLPLKSLQGWASMGGPEAEERRRKVESLAKLASGQRFHYNMKGGLLGDLPAEKRRSYRESGMLISEEDLPPLFQQVSDLQVRRHLQKGFGDEIADLFHDKDEVERVSEAHFQAEVPDLERLALSQSIIDRM